MKFTILFALCFMVAGLHAQIEVDQQVAQFYTDDDETYLELYTGVISSSIGVVDSQGVRSIDVKLLVSKGGEILHADKYVISQSSDFKEDLFHLQRISLDTGLYRLETQLIDVSDFNNKITNVVYAEVQSPPSTGQVAMSTLQLLGNVVKDETHSRRSKNGYIMEPLKFKFLNNNYPVIYLYLETYQTDQMATENYYLRYDIVRPQSQDTVLSRVKRRKTSPIDPVLITETNDSTWASGDYIIHMHLMNRKQEIYASSSASFVLSNPSLREKEDDYISKLSDEELNYSLKALTAKIDSRDMDILNSLISDGSRKARESFLSGYWKTFSPHDPAFGYNQYMKVVRALDDLFFEGFGHGFETDRGYIYLKYGRPDQQIRVEDESTAPPYEIWYYADFPATKQNNVKFVFYCPVAASFDLLHSTARTEVNNPQWLLKLYRNSPEDQLGNAIDARGVEQQWNRRAEEIFNNF